ncbi:MAG TPA: hypothetical protein VG734_25400 [Lacunisphaera sp.]|nr:hypothetical protein [Lacunisphaera sp.]
MAVTSDLTSNTAAGTAPAKGGPVDPACPNSAAVLKPARQWARRYVVEGGAGETGGPWFHARDTQEGKSVLLRIVAAGHAPGRRDVWGKLQGGSLPHLQRPLAVYEEGGERSEVWEPAKGVAIRRWLTATVRADLDQVRAILRQLTAAVESLHFSGVAHFSIGPDTVYIVEGGSGPTITLGGFDHAALFGAKELVAIPVDPFTAPPEAAGLFQHSPGELLCGWDWWSVGRLVQELLLGHHVAQDVPEGQIPRTLPATATALLLEREIPGVRAGAVEIMEDLDPSLARLLRGLLASSVTGRWGAQEIKEWLAGQSPVERYSAARNEEFFRFGGRGYAVAEFARILQASPAPKEGIRHLFAVAEQDTLSFFLADNSRHEKSEQQLIAAREMVGATALRQFAEPLRQEIAAAVAWHGLASGSFIWRGQSLSEVRLREGLQNERDFHEWRIILQALATPLVLTHLGRHDSDVVRLLERLVKTASEAEAMATKCHWLKPNTPGPLKDLWAAAAESDARLQAARERLQRDYAASDHAAFQTIFAERKPTRTMQVLVAWAETNPTVFGLVTHAEMKLRRKTALLEEGKALARVIFWLRLDRGMRSCPWLFGSRWLLVLTGLVAASLVAVHFPGSRGLALGLLPILALAGVRLGANRWQARLVEHWSAGSGRWGWWDGPKRCSREVMSAAEKDGTPSTLGAALAAMKRVHGDLRELVANGEQVPIPHAPRHAATWAVAVFGWVALAGLAGGSVRWGLVHPPSLAAHATAWERPSNKEKEDRPRRPASNQATGIKITWPHKVTDDAFEITVKGSFTPTAEQTAAGLDRGRAIVAPYKPETISSLVAIFVRLEDGRGGLLLFDGKKGALFSRTGVIIDFVPMPRSGLLIGDKAAFFVE